MLRTAGGVFRCDEGLVCAGDLETAAQNCVRTAGVEIMDDKGLLK